MKKFAPLALLAAAATFAVPGVAFAAEGETSQSVRAATEEAAVELNAGQMLYSTKGNRIASIYRVNRDGDAQLILNGRMVTVPASTIAEVDGKVTTSLTKRDLLRAK
ncbi:MAG: hypothetical protein KDE55_02880 [Novosphingobium sp.]|nr:hypothetical protein [Novosphingobium sp.]